MFEYEIIKKRNSADENKKTNFSFEITKGKNQNTNKSNEADFSFEITKKRTKAVQDDNQTVDYSNFTSFFEMENGKLPTFDTVVRRMGYSDVVDFEEYSKQNPELFEAMGGVKYDPVNAPVKVPNISKVAANNVVNRFKNTDVKAVGEIFKTLASGEWQDADTMKGYTEKVNQYVNDYVALDSMGYFNYLPIEERKGYVESLRDIKKYANNLKEVFSGYDDSDGYKDAVMQAKKQTEMHEKMKNEDLDVGRKKLADMYEEYDYWKSQAAYFPKGDIYTIPTIDMLKISNFQKWLNDKNIKPSYFQGKTLEQAKNEIDEFEKYLKNAEFVQKGYKLTNDARNDRNYDKWVQEGAIFSPNDFGKMSIDVTERIGHISSSSMDKYRAAAIALSDWQRGETTNLSNFVGHGKNLISKYHLMDEDEFKIFAYWRKYDKENGTKLAYDYIDSIEETLNIREGQAIGEQYKDKHALLKIMYGVEAGLDQFASGVENAFNFTDDYIPTTSTQYASQYIRNDLRDVGPDLPKWLGGTSLGQAAYDMVNTSANMVPSMATGLVAEFLLPGTGTYVTAGLMGLSATGNAYQQMLNEGYSKTQSRTYATLVGASEASLSALLSGMIGGKVTEKAIENVIKGIDNGFLRFAVRWGMSGVSEIPEESLQTLIEPILQNIALGYEKNKLEDTDWSQVAYDGLLGGISGLGLGGVTSAVSTGVEQHTWNKAGKNVRANNTIPNVLDIVQLTPQGSDAYATYTRYAKKGINAKNITNTQIGRLYDELNNYSKDVLNDNSSTASEKENAVKILNELSEADEKSTFDKETIASIERSVAYEGALHESVDALIESGLESAENTKSHKLAIELQNKIRSGKEITTQEIVKLQEANEKAFVDEAQVELKNRAQHYGKNKAQLFVHIYDKNVNGDTDAYQNSFNLVSELVENNFSIEYIMDHKGVLTKQQVNEIIKNNGAVNSIQALEINGISDEEFGEATNKDIKYSYRDIEKGKKRYYNEFNSLAMQWAYSASRNVGDAKIFNVNGKSFALLEATGDGCIELARGSYREVKRLERLFNTENGSFDRYDETYKSFKGRNISDLRMSSDGGMFGRDSGDVSTTQEGIERNTSTKNAEHVFPDNKKTYDEINNLTEDDIKSSSNTKVYNFSFLNNGDDFTNTEYNKLISKRPIKVSKQEWSKINSHRTQKYADVSDENIPVLDIIKLAQYNKINEAYQYFIRNNDKYVFDIIGKKKIKPNIEKIYKEEVSDYEKTNSQNDRNGHREGLDRSSDESARNRGTVRKDESSIGQSSKFDVDYDFRQGDFDSRRVIKPSDSDNGFIYDQMGEIEENINELYENHSLLNELDTKAKKYIDSLHTSTNEKYADREHYWHPKNMTVSEVSLIERIARRELNTTDNYIDNGNKWLYNKTGDKTYFALYSTAHEDKPTILYASKNNKAINEYSWFVDLIAEMGVVENERDDIRRKTINEVLAHFGYALDEDSVYSWKPTTTRNKRNVGAYSSESGIRPSEALLNCIRNIGKKYERQKINYSNRDNVSIYSRIGETEGNANKLYEHYDVRSKANTKTGNLSFSSNVDISVVDFTNSIAGKIKTKNGIKVNWEDLSVSQQSGIIGMNRFAEKMGMKVKWITNGVERGINGLYEVDGDEITIDIYAGKAAINSAMKDTIIPTASHEMVHWAKDKSPEIYRKLDAFVFDSLAKVGIDEETALNERRRKMEKAHPGVIYTDAAVREEVIARACEDMLANTETFRECLETMTESEKKTLLDKVREIIKNIKEWVNTFLKGQKSDSAEAKEIRKDMNRFLEQVEIFEGMILDAAKNKTALQNDGKMAEKNTTGEGGVKYSLVGRTVDGIGIYKTNYPEGTQKSIKQNDLISLIQNIWSNNPINLKIVEGGTIKEIEAKFNPKLSERSDLSKIVFGNRKGNGSERRMTLDLSSDLYQIAADSRYLYSKDAIPKPNNTAYDGVIKYHYFITNLVYKDNENNYTSCYMNIDVKQNSDGNWFYSFAIEKGSAPQTLLAAVTENSATLPTSSISQISQKSQEKRSNRDADFFSHIHEKHTRTNQLGREEQKNTTDNGGVKFMARYVEKGKKRYYNEFNSLAMQWAYSASTNVGDTKIFNVSGKSFALLEATEDGYIEIIRGSYKEVYLEYEQLYSQKDRSLDGYLKEIRSAKRGDFRNLQSNRYRGNDNGNSGQIGAEELQTDTAGNLEHLFNDNKGKSEVKFSLRKNVEQTTWNKAQKNTADKDDVKLSKRDYYRLVENKYKKETLSQDNNRNSSKHINEIDTNEFIKGLREKENKAKQDEDLQPSADGFIDNANDTNYNDNSIEEGENYGSEDTELLERGRISTANRGNDVLREPSTNSKKLAACLEISQGTNAVLCPAIWAGESGWLDAKPYAGSKETRKSFDSGIFRRIRGIKLSGKDTIGGTVSSEILEKFKNTICKDENGNLLSLYHWTDKIFDRFTKGEFGFHFGTLKAANDRYLQTKEDVLNITIGVYKEVVLNITNPIEISDDMGEWSARWVAFQLLQKGIIDGHKYDNLSKLPGFDEKSYDNPAAEAVRKILSKNGYDGIVYENLSEDAGSYSLIALYPEQIVTVAENGILKENSGINRATSDEEVAFYNYEEKQTKKIDTNELIKGLREKENKAKQDEDLQPGADGFIDNANDTNYNDNSIEEGENYGSEDTELLERGRISTANRGNDVLREPSANSRTLAACLEMSQGTNAVLRPAIWAGESGWLDAKPYAGSKETRKSFDSGIFRRIRGIKLSGKDTIGGTVSSEILEKFKNTICKDENGNLLSLYHWTDKIFDRFTKGEFGFHFGTLKAANDRYLQTKEDVPNITTGVYKEVFLNITNPIEMSDGASEWTAGWVALQLFEKGLITESDYNELLTIEGFYDNTYDNSAAEAVRKILSENGYDGIVYENLSEDAGSYSLIALYPEQIVTVAENGILKENSGISRAISDEEVAFSMPIGNRKRKDNNVIELSKDNELSKKIGDLRGAAKYKVIQQYILDVLSGEEITLSDGKIAVVDKSDALHIANKAANKKTAQISAIKKLVKKAVLIAEEESNKGRKFDYFYYYGATVKYDGAIFNIYLNVGRATNTGEYHIYDITNKIRDTANRINGLERPKPNEGYALTNGISNSSITKKLNIVNENYTTNTDTFDDIAKLDSKEIGYIEQICEKLGVQVVFEDLREMMYKGKIISPDGYVENDTGIIHLNTYAQNPIGFVFKHELTHYSQKAKGYLDFAKQVKRSGAYQKWITEKMGESDVRVAEYKYKQKVLATHVDIDSISDPKIEAEMIADFVGDMLFTDNGSGMVTLVNDIEVKYKNKVVQFVLDFMSYLKEKIIGMDSIALELSRLEDKFNELLSEAKNSGVYDDEVKFIFNDKNSSRSATLSDDINFLLNKNVTESMIEENIVKVVTMGSVADLTGNEFEKGSVDLITQVENFFNSVGNIAKSKYGDVELTRVGIKASLGHGIGRKKAIAFKAVPNVIKYGEVINYQKNWKNRGHDTAIFAAPITIDAQKYFLAAVINVELNKNSYYLHEVALQKVESNASFKTGTVKNGTPSDALPSIYTLLQKLQVVNENTPIVTDNSVYKTLNIKEQNYIKGICNKLGLKVVFEDLREMVYKGEIISPDGYELNGVLYLNLYAQNPIGFVLKHELTHYSEKVKGYLDFAKQVKQSGAYKKWITEKMGESNVRVAEYKYKQKVLATHVDIDSISDPKIEAEMIADFVGEMLFTDNGSGLVALLVDVDTKKRNKFVQWIIDFISYLKKKFIGHKQITFELSLLEDGFKRLLVEASQEYDKIENQNESYVNNESDISFCFAHCEDEELTSKAKQLEESGVENIDIYKQIGVVKNVFGDWVASIDLDNYRFYPFGTSGAQYNLIQKKDKIEGTLRDIVVWPELYQRFPEFEKVKVVIRYSEYSYDKIRFIPDENGEKIIINQKLCDDYRNRTDISAKSEMVRAIQQMIQFKEGNYIGKNYDHWRKLEENGKLPYSERHRRYLTADDMMRYFIDNYDAEMASRRQHVKDVVTYQGKGKGYYKNSALYLPNINPDDVIVYDKRNRLIALSETKEEKAKASKVAALKQKQIEKEIEKSQVKETGDATQKIKDLVWIKEKKHSAEFRQKFSNIKGGNSGAFEKSEIASERRFENQFNIISKTPITSLDTIGREIHPRIRKRANGTIAVNNEGQLTSLYALSLSGDNVFKQLQTGLKLGTIDSVIESFKDLDIENISSSKIKIFEFFVIAKDPIRLKYEPSKLSTKEIGKQLADKGYLTKGEYNSLMRADSAHKQITTGFKRTLIDMGFDSIVYENQKYDKGSMTLIVLDESQLIPVAKDGILIEDNSVGDLMYKNYASDENMRVDGAQENKEKLTMYIKEPEYDLRTARKQVDSRIKMGDAGCFEKTHLSSEEAYEYVRDELEKNFNKELSGYDKAGRKFTNKALKNLDRCAFRDENGDILTFSLWNTKPKNISQAAKMGIEFGSVNSAFKKFFAHKDGNVKRYNGVFEEFILNCGAPLILPFDSWNTIELAEYLLDEKKISQSYYEKLSSLRSINSPTYISDAAQKLREEIRTKGYDCIVFAKSSGEKTVVTLYDELLIPISQNGILNQDCKLYDDAEYKENNDPKASGVIEPKKATMRDFSKVKDIILSETSATKKLKHLTEFLSYSSNSILEENENIKVGFSGVLENISNNFWNFISICNQFTKETVTEINQYDTADRYVEDEIRQATSNTKFKDKDGRLLSLFFWNKYGDYSFKHSALGYNLTTLEGAHNDYLAEREKHPQIKTGEYVECYVKASKPYILKNPLTELTPKKLAEELYKNGVLSGNEYRVVRETVNSDDANRLSGATRCLNSILVKKGYDCVIYMDGSRDVSGVGIIVFDQSQLIPVSVNGQAIENNVEKNHNKLLDGVGDVEYNEIEKVKCINERLEGKKHAVTKVPFLKKYIAINGKTLEVVVPEFESLFDAQLPEEFYTVSDRRQINECYSQLRNELKNNYELRKCFTEKELKKLEKGKRLKKYTWHHDAVVGRMQLVNRYIHEKTGHKGGRFFWGGGSKNR